MKYSKRSVAVSILASLTVLLSGCLEFVSIDQPRSILPGSTFTVHIEVLSEGGPTPSFAICLPEAWSVVDDKIACTGGYTDDILYDPNLPIELEVAPEGYRWWTGKGDPNGSSDRGSSYGQLEIQTHGETGLFFLDYVIWGGFGRDRSSDHLIAVVNQFTPRQLSTSVDGNEVSLNWTPPQTEEELVGYHVYRNGLRLTNTPEVDPTYVDERLEPGVFFYAVSSLFESDAEHVLPYEVEALVFSGGAGSPEDPYQISLGEQLLTLGQYPDLLDRHFVLKSDIDLDPILFEGETRDRAMIGVFSGSFDGNDFTLSNLNIAVEEPSDGWFPMMNQGPVGLFGRVESGAQVKNLTLIDANIVGTRDTTGGLAGENYGRLISCQVDGTVSGISPTGGLAGFNYGVIMSCHNVCAVSGRDSVGGLVGRNDTNAKVWKSSNSGTVAGESNVGGLVGINDYEATYSSFWDVQASRVTTSPSGQGLSSAQMRDIATFQAAGWDFVGQVQDGLHEIWEMSEAQGAPGLAVLNGYEPTQLQGAGTRESPYIVSDAFELGAIHYHDTDAHYRLVSDVNLSETHWGMAVIPHFTGVFDGAGHVIYHLRVTGNNNAAMIGKLGPGGMIANLRLEAVDINGKDLVGALVGENSGATVTRSYSSGQVSGRRYVGGVVGRNSNEYQYLIGDAKSNITVCYSAAAVTGEKTVGGLVGQNDGVLDMTFSTGTTTGQREVGGLVGENGSGTIIHSYCAGKVEGNSRVGGLVGDGWPDRIQGCFWDITASTQETSLGGTGLVSTEMQDTDTFVQAGWDFADESQNGTCDYWYVQHGQTPQLTVFANRAVRMPGGLGTIERPYLIRNARDLGMMWRAPSAHYCLETSIDLAGTRWSRAIVPWFDGSFDGKGYRLDNLNIQGMGDLGLFGRLDPDAEILGLGLEQVDVNALGDRVGGLAAQNRGAISGCYATGIIVGNRQAGGLVGVNLGSILGSSCGCLVQGNWETGGLVGDNSGQISRCSGQSMVRGEGSVGGLVGSNEGQVSVSRSTSEVFGLWDVGGLAGKNSSDIRDCYSIGAVTGESQIGGLVGLNLGNIFKSYSRGLVTGDYRPGGLVGDDITCWGHGTSCAYGYSSGSLWDIETSSQPDSAGGNGLASVDMQTAQPFLDAGWDFVDETENGEEDIWWIDEGQDAPRLWWETAEQ